jgi:N-acetylglucosaminyldiphosphoundecaprenol N-acetyl-beta-D-mannosaminyltransferase
MTVRVQLFGVPVTTLTEERVLTKVREAIANGETLRILAANPEKIMRAQSDRALASALAGAEILIPDGIGVVLALRWLGLARVTRITGADLMPKICAMAENEGFSVFVFGASEATNERAFHQLQREFPNLRIVGRANGYADATDNESLCRTIAAHAPAIVFVALGSPAQEYWIHDNWSRLNACVIQGVGGTLDALTGSVRRAPEHWRRWGLEWLYRLLTQPSRIRRQIVLPTFLSRVLMARLRR